MWYCKQAVEFNSRARGDLPNDRIYYDIFYLVLFSLSFSNFTYFWRCRVHTLLFLSPIVFYIKVIRFFLIIIRKSLLHPFIIHSFEMSDIISFFFSLIRLSTLFFSYSFYFSLIIYFMFFCFSYFCFDIHFYVTQKCHFFLSFFLLYSLFNSFIFFLL